MSNNNIKNNSGAYSGTYSSHGSTKNPNRVSTRQNSSGSGSTSRSAGHTGGGSSTSRSAGHTGGGSSTNCSTNRHSGSSVGNTANKTVRSTQSGSKGTRQSNPSKNKASMLARRKRRQRNRILRISGLLLSLVLLVITIVFIVFMNRVNLLPASYEVLIATLLILIVAFIAITQRWIGLGIFTKVLAVIMSVVLVIGSVYLDATHKAIKKMSNETTVKSTVGVYVLSDSGINEILELEGSKCGRLSTLDPENTRKMIDHIKKDSKINLDYKGYDGIALMVEALYNKDVNCIIFNDSYLGMLTEMEQYKDFESKTKCIYTQSYITQIKQPDEEVVNDDHIISMYISGIDTRTGDVTSNSNSDVNILCIANLKTHQILLVNTPRDYYIPTSVSNGAKDKLTHAGVYGVDCSMDTLELLYDIKIDYYFKVNFVGFIEIVDLLGGITVHSDYDFVTHHGGDHIVVGNNYLNGKQALGFVRERYAFATGDNQRGKNTMAMIKALVTKMASSAMLANYTKILESISDCMITNMSYEKIGEIAKQQLNGMPSWDIQMYSVEGRGATKSTFSYTPPTYVMIPKQETVDQARTYMKQIFNDQIISVQ